MTTFISQSSHIAYPIERVFATLSDLNNLSGVLGALPTSAAADVVYDRDSLSLSVSPVGKITLRVVRRQEPTTVEFVSEQSPIAFTATLVLTPLATQETVAKMTLEVELNPFIKGMVSKPLQETLDKITAAISTIHY